MKFQKSLKKNNARQMNNIYFLFFSNLQIRVYYFLEREDNYYAFNCINLLANSRVNDLHIEVYFFYRMILYFFIGNIVLEIYRFLRWVAT